MNVETMIDGFLSEWASDEISQKKYGFNLCAFLVDRARGKGVTLDHGTLEKAVKRAFGLHGIHAFVNGDGWNEGNEVMVKTAKMKAKKPVENAATATIRKLAKLWDKDESLQEEFSGSFGAYLLYMSRKNSGVSMMDK